MINICLAPFHLIFEWLGCENFGWRLFKFFKRWIEFQWLIWYLLNFTFQKSTFEFIESRRLNINQTTSPFKCRCQVNIFWNNSAIYQVVHAAFDILLGDRRWICEWIVSNVSGENSVWSFGNFWDAFFGFAFSFKCLSFASEKFVWIFVVNFG